MQNKFAKTVLDLCQLDYETIQSILEIYERNIILATDSENFQDLQTILHNYYNKSSKLEKELNE